MFSFFAGFFTRESRKLSSAQPRRQSPPMRLKVEELLPRVLPSANPFNMAWGHYAVSATHPAFTAFVTGMERSKKNQGDEGSTCSESDSQTAKVPKP